MVTWIMLMAVSASLRRLTASPSQLSESSQVPP